MTVLLHKTALVNFSMATTVPTYIPPFVNLVFGRTLSVRVWRIEKKWKLDRHHLWMTLRARAVCTCQGAYLHPVPVDIKILKVIFMPFKL